jgi:hypothetical protein
VLSFLNILEKCNELLKLLKEHALKYDYKLELNQINEITMFSIQDYISLKPISVIEKFNFIIEEEKLKV